MVNHYNRISEITTKVGLSHNLREYLGDVDHFYPRSYDLADAGELDE